jgi:hypothetical protein
VAEWQVTAVIAGILAPTSSNYSCWLGGRVAGWVVELLTLNASVKNQLCSTRTDCKLHYIFFESRFVSKNGKLNSCSRFTLESNCWV